MRKPPALAPGARVAVVAPASPFPRADFELGLSELRRLGYEPVYDERVFDRRLYLAGDAHTRAASFMDAWHDPGVAAIIAARGGYGSAQILPLLSRDDVCEAPKLFVGCSDLTALLTYLTTGCGIVSAHGPMVAGQLGRGAAGYDLASWVSVVSGTDPVGPVGGDTLDVFVAGEAAGPLVGGNLTQLAASMGTPFAFAPPEGSVLFLEDVGERPYRIDRMLTQLRLAGVLDRASALVFGEMLNCDETDGSIRCRDMIRQWVAGFPGPVVYGLAAGHTAGPAVTLPLGIRARVRAATAGSLVFEDAAVA